MLSKELEVAVNCAVFDIERKEEKREKKNEKQQQSAWLNLLRKIKSKPAYETLGHTERISKQELSTRLMEGKTSPLMESSLIDRKVQRRSAVSERNETERTLVKQAVKNHIKAEYAKQYNFHNM